ncbi:MAG: C25 family cysteine peptidase, partial [Candidatus Pacearchaeota archaeon]|nr:C25 family cysteine peptidase [Candidatus Pacearchaeota archaeon]
GLFGECQAIDPRIETCLGKQCGDDGCGGTCGSCDKEGVCLNGTCKYNEKRMELYSDKELFLISDKNWKDVLPWVPVTTWTGKENCQSGYETAGNVCVYPFLIYHEENQNETILKSDSTIRSDFSTSSVFRDASIYESKILWSEQRYDYANIFMYDFDTETEKRITNSGSALFPDIYENKIVFRDSRNDIYGNSRGTDIFLYDLDSDLEFRLTNLGIYGFPSIYEDKVVFNCYPTWDLELDEPLPGSTNTDICLYDLSIDSDNDGIPNYMDNDTLSIDPAFFVISSHPDIDLYPRIYEDKIVWASFLKGFDVYMYDLSIDSDNDGIPNYMDNDTPSIDPAEFEIVSDHMSQNYPDIYEDKIVWQDVENYVYSIQMYDLSIDSDNDGIPNYMDNDTPSIDPAREVIFEAPFVNYPRMQNNKIIWEWKDSTKNPYNNLISMYDSDKKEIIQLVEDNTYTQMSPSSYGNRIVWTGDIPPDENHKYKRSAVRTMLLNISEIKESYVSGSIDADSLIYFMQQYNPSKVTIFGETNQELDNLLISPSDFGADLEQSQIQRISMGNYLSYWDSYKDIVYVEDNYELALLASTYASLINVPLIIQESYLDSDETFENINLICVGEVNRNCTEHYSIEQLQHRYLEKTNTTKIILVNPSDLDLNLHSSFFPEKSDSPINNIYGKNSLISPILASAKHELILSLNNSDGLVIDSFIEDKFHDFNRAFDYLTIVASPLAIPTRHLRGVVSDIEIYSTYDTVFYADFDNDSLPDLGVGRIQGITSSDVSSYVARDLFYSEIDKSLENILFMATAEPDNPLYYYMVNNANKWSVSFQNIGYNVIKVVYDLFSNSFDSSYWKDKSFISYQDHGSRNWAGISSEEIPNLNNPIIFADACSTCETYNADSFCNNAIRKGAISYVGEVGVSFVGGTIYKNMTQDIYQNNMTIGKAFSKNFVNDYAFSYNGTYYGTFQSMKILLGDPTFKPIINHELNESLYWQFPYEE